MKKPIIVTAIFVFATLLISNTYNLFASELTVSEIITKANEMAFYQGKDGKAKVNMTITDSQGRIRNREFTLLRLNQEIGGDQKFYVFFNKPQDIKNMVYMVWKHIEKNDDRWMYLPALDLVKRIAASDKRSSFVGSNFVYEDISGRGLKEDTHELIEETEKFYKIKNLPKAPESVEFSFFEIWIDKKSFMPYKAQYYDNQNKPYKLIEAIETKQIQGYVTVTKSKATDLTNNSYTINELSSIKYDIGLDESIFTERYLKRPPNKWLQ